MAIVLGVLGDVQAGSGSLWCGFAGRSHKETGFKSNASLMEGQWYTVREEKTFWRWRQCGTLFFDPAVFGGMTITTIQTIRLFKWVSVSQVYWYKSFLQMNFFGILGNTYRVEAGPFDPMYEIIDADYENYAVLYGCDNHFFGLYHTYWAQILSREPWLPLSYYKKAEEALFSVGYAPKINFFKSMGGACDQGVEGDFDEV